MISLDKFRCPYCKAPMELSENKKSILCQGSLKRHCFDLASAGYVNFATPAQKGAGDSKLAIRSRTDFLESGAYWPICQTVLTSVNKYCHGGTIIDVGCGEGYYTNNVAKMYSGDVIGFDLSKYGIEYASKSSKKEKILNSFFAVSSVYTLPIADNSVDGIINVFAPCVENEYARILKENGVLITAGAGENHLLGLKRAVYDITYKNGERNDMPHEMYLEEERSLQFEILLEDKSQIAALFAMTPYYYRTSEADIKKLELLEKLETDVDVKIKIFRKRKK